MLLSSREIAIELSTYCGANCVMCPRHQYSSSWEHIDKNLFESTLDQAVKLGALSLNTCGYGDIFMDASLEDKLAYAKKTYPFLKIFASTTAHMLDKSRHHLISYIDTLRISNYGTTKEVFEKIHRGSLKFEKVIENIEGILTLPKTSRPYLIMTFLVLPTNEHQIEDWKRRWEPRVNEIQIWKPHSWVSRFPSDASKISAQAPRSCGRPFRGEPFIHANGDVSVCCFDFNKEMIIGSLRKEKLKDILEGALFHKVKEIHKNFNIAESELMCRNCDQIFDRSDALIYSSNKDRRVGTLTGHPDLINDVLHAEE